MAKRKLPNDVAEMTLDQLKKALVDAKEASYSTEVALVVRNHSEGERLLYEAAYLLSSLSDTGASLKALATIPDKATIDNAVAHITNLIKFNEDKIKTTLPGKLQDFYILGLANAKKSLLTAGMPPDMVKIVEYYKQLQVDLAQVKLKWDEAFSKYPLSTLLPDLLDHLEAA